MLDKLRENKSSSILTFVTGLIIIVFIFWGSGMTRGQRSENQVAATVNGKGINLITLNRAVANQMERMRRFSQRPPTKADEALIKQKVLDELIEEELLKQEARRLGLVVSDWELQKEITTSPYFKDENGNFDLKAYHRILKRNPSFESDQRDRLLIAKLEDLVQNSVQVSDADLQEAYEKENTKINLEYVKMPFSKFEKDMTISAEERATFIKDHKDEIKARYDQDFEKLYNLPKKVEASHILLKIDPTDSAELKAQVHEKIKQIQEKARTADFAELAREYSEDPGSTAKGGDLGYFDEKRMDPAFSKVAFSTPKGQVSDVVETRFGLHLIKVMDIQEAQVKKLEDVQDQIADELIKEKKGPELARKEAEKLQAAWAKGGADLDAALKAADLTIQETGPVAHLSDTLRGIGKSEELANAAFALPAGAPPVDKLFTVGDSFVLIRLKDRQPADMSNFAKEKGKLTAQTLRQKQSDFLQAWKDGLKAKASIQTNIDTGSAPDAS